MEKLISLVGLLAVLAICYLCSCDRQKVPWKTVLVGVSLQIFFSLIILKTNVGRTVFEYAGFFFNSLLSYTNEGSKFLFGSLVDVNRFGFVFATMVLPTIIFVSSLTSILYHLGLMQKVVRFAAKVMMKFMGTSGSESLAVAGNIFVGQTEAPLLIRPYIDSMTRSEMMALMTGGMATMAGGVLAAYVAMGIDAGHLLAASVMSAPAALVCAKILIPETEVSATAQAKELEMEKAHTANIIDAASVGAAEGLKLAVNVAAMLLAFIALIAMCNGILAWLGGLFGWEFLSFEWIMGWVFWPVAFLMGTPLADCQLVGVLLAKKLVLNEFVAYVDLTEMMKADQLSERGIILSTYALCGFANFSSIAIQMGGISTLAPKRRQDLARLGLRSLLGGTIACLMTAMVAGLII